MCPFHDDVNASMKVNLPENNFYCFGCGVSGDALAFVSLVNKGMDDLGACFEYYRILRSRKVKALAPRDFVPKSKVEDAQLQTEAWDYYHGLKSIDWSEYDGPEKDYMAGRGFTAESLNICKAKVNYSRSYPIIFPMMDMGKYRGWVCRTMDKKVEEKRKYLYNEGFSRRDTLVGDYDSKVVVVVEGYMDWLKMRQYGVKKVVAILGWKATEQQIKKLKNAGVKYVISALDNDLCGNKGSSFLEAYFKVIRFQYPKGVKDPGEMDLATFKKVNHKAKLLYAEVSKDGTHR